MKNKKLICKYRKKKYKRIEGAENSDVPNIINRNFHSDTPLTKLTTDVTEMATPFGKVFLSPIMDMYNNEIVASSISWNNDGEMVMDMLNEFTNKYPEIDKKGIILHSDQGGLYKMKKYIKFAKSNGIIRSMSRCGDCYDNAIIESFFGDIKNYIGNNLYSITSKDGVKEYIKQVIEFFNNEWMLLKLGGLSPVEYRTGVINSEAIQLIS